MSATTGNYRFRLASDYDGQTKQGFWIDLGPGWASDANVVVEGVLDSFCPSVWGLVFHATSANGREWSPIAAALEGDKISFRASDIRRYLTYTIPYSRGQDRWFERELRSSEAFRSIEVGKSSRGAAITAWMSRSAIGLPAIAFVARQHAGESTAAYFLEGIVEGISELIAAGRRVPVGMVPIANPDGLKESQYRCNAQGLDLNRQWGAASCCEATAIFEWLRRQSDLRLFVDIHADESTRRTYAVFGRALSSFSIRAALLDRYTETGNRLPVDASIDSSYLHAGIAANFVESQLGIEALMIEVPLSDHIGTHPPRLAAQLRAEGRVFIVNAADVLLHCSAS